MSSSQTIYLNSRFEHSEKLIQVAIFERSRLPIFIGPENSCVGLRLEQHGSEVGPKTIENKRDSKE